MGATILLVDDQPDTALKLARSLIAHGFAVLVAEDGVQAIRQASRHAPDVILIDMMLGDTDALSMCEDFSRQSALAGIPRVIMGALASEMAATPAHHGLADAFLSKPSTHSEVIRVIEAVLRPPAPASCRTKALVA